jgi:peptidoglycan DL-endopeptidase LytE
VSVQNLTNWNNITSNTISVGQKLSLLAPHSHLSYRSYTVKLGDSLWGIAKSKGLTVTQLKTFNNLTTDSIYVGQTLKLTGVTTSSPAPAPTPVEETGFNVDALIAEAKKHIGVPYVWGGNTPSGFDCSGFLKYVYNTQGVTIPRTVETIWNAAKPISSLEKGDLVFFTTYAPGASHAGIYLGDNKFIQAGSSTGVTISDMNNSYWKARYIGFKAITR